MSDPQFHSVDPESLKNIPLEVILSPHLASKQVDYTIPVPTEDQTIPHRVRVGARQTKLVGDKLVNPESSLMSQYRGRIGGC